MTNDKWRFWIDRGGTFTDIVARRPDGGLVTHKLLSDNPERYVNSALQGIREVLGISGDRPLPVDAIAEVCMGTTIGTNALLERKGEPLVLAVTRGFGDALRIGYQNRPDIFARSIVLPEQIYKKVIEIDERMDAHGVVLTPLDRDRTRTALQQIYEQGFRSIAIVFMHGYRHAQHEQQAAEIAREIGFTQISASHAVSPLMKLVSRGDTTVVDAYLTPVLRRYVDGIAKELGNTRLFFMQSNGGLADYLSFKGRDCVLSGPAGGVVGAVNTGITAGFQKIIGFDMGGTSTDVSHYAGEYERTFDTLVAGVRMRVPMLKIHTVAAGGGSILHFDGLRMRVGPDSAGADPGPACYRRDGPLTVTDCNVMLGKLDPESFPKVFGPNGNAPLDAEQVQRKFHVLAEKITRATGRTHTAIQAAEGFLKIAVANMANAIKRVSVQSGYDVTEYVLACFGGAGGQHACQVADALGMKKILIHPCAGVLSAYGMGLADIRCLRERSIESMLDKGLLPQLEAELKLLAKDACAELLCQGVEAGDISLSHKVHIRYEGTDTALPVFFSTLKEMIAAFEAAHRQRYGFILSDKNYMVEAVSTEAVGKRFLSSASAIGADTEKFLSSASNVSAERCPGERVDGPAIIVEPTGTNVIDAGWQAEVTPRNELLLTRITPLPSRQVRAGAAADPVMLEIFNNLFMSAAEQMGATLANTASSVNIKERLDFSCALFDCQGRLIANAPHVPVHLGSMGDSVQAVIREQKKSMRPGDVYVLNNPYRGGTHLPDVTAVTPVFAKSDPKAGAETILFYVASRGHHADIGGVSPGSMPPHSRHIEEEGILIDIFKLVDRGRFRETEMLQLLKGEKQKTKNYPARNPEQNLADLRAQIAANAKGVQEVHKMIGHFGLETVNAYMQHVQDNAELLVRRVLDVLKPGKFSYAMDDGSEIKVRISIDKAGACIDFSGTSPQQATNFNAPSAVCKAAALYVFRTLVDDDIPLNAGCLKPLRIIIPQGCLLNPVYPAAVAAGNVETSQYITDALYGALGVMAASQGTMNNFTFGNDRYQYYETICGGSGAGPGFHGVDAVHTHMTNSRLTDPEVLEWRFPVLLEAFYIRKGSGGAGRYRGGCGVVRRIRFCEAMNAAILSSHRVAPPYGMAGGKPGKPGRNRLERADGSVEELSGTAETAAGPGDVFVIETPGGGGFQL
ncbi:MAG: 5-oxoprolinase [Gammaproteobacteria bacterium]|nr:5-oxoprolinase [Gammaproteobacteria bacterium]